MLRQSMHEETKRHLESEAERVAREKQSLESERMQIEQERSRLQSEHD